MGVDPYLVIMWTSHRLIWDPGATFVSLTCRWRLCHIRMGGVESDKRKSCDRDGLVIGSLGAGRSLTPRARRPWSRRTGEINCPVRGIPNVHVPRVSAGPDISGIITTRFCGLKRTAHEARGFGGCGVLGYVN